VGEEQKENPEYLFQKFCRKWNNNGKETQIIHLRDFSVNGITAERKPRFFI
jgi:hypothetical protein